jgi:C4-dicarboxylate transporter DctM subunit
VDEPFVVAGLSFAVMLFLVLGGVPIFAAMGLVGIAGLIFDTGFTQALALTQSLPFAIFASYSLALVPLFFLMGDLISQSGLASNAYNCSYKLLGNHPGGLGMATTLASGIAAAAMGSSTANAALFTKIALPEMRRLGYDKSFSLGIIACTGTFAIMIPPSIPLVIYGTLTEESVGKLLIAGVVPGIITLIAYLACIRVMVALNPRLGPRSQRRLTLQEKLRSLSGLWGILVLFILVLGGIYAGVFTPTAAGAVGAFGAFIIALSKKGLNKAAIASISLSSVQGISSIMVLLIGGFLFSKHLVLCGFVEELVSLVTVRVDQPFIVMMAICMMYLIMGCIMSTLSMLVITVPVLYPVVTALGYSGIWFGIVCIKLIEIALVTPPIGGNVFVTAQAAGKDTSIPDVFRGVLPFIIMDIIVLLILFLFPAVATYLPSKMYAS